jgi:hypothetical protein
VFYYSLTPDDEAGDNLRNAKRSLHTDTADRPKRFYFVQSPEGFRIMYDLTRSIHGNTSFETPVLQNIQQIPQHGKKE